jgi:hypothetical protein
MVSHFLGVVGRLYGLSLDGSPGFVCAVFRRSRACRCTGVRGVVGEDVDEA